MRAIKFRAWKKPNGIEKGFMYFPERLFLNSNGKVWHIDGEKFSNSYVLEHGFAVLMQYTGLKDKNGVEIYEGDIYHQGDPKITYTVVWHDSGLIGKQNRSSSYAGLSYWHDLIEVIGNIYENPELLEVEANDTSQ